MLSTLEAVRAVYTLVAPDIDRMIDEALVDQKAKERAMAMVSGAVYDVIADLTTVAHHDIRRLCPETMTFSVIIPSGMRYVRVERLIELDLQKTKKDIAKRVLERAEEPHHDDEDFYQ